MDITELLREAKKTLVSADQIMELNDRMKSITDKEENELYPTKEFLERTYKI